MHFPVVLAVLPALAAVTSAANSQGCGKDLPPKFTTDRTADLKLPNFPGERTYRLHLPSSYNKNTPHPLYFSFHGASRTDDEQESLSLMSERNFDPHGIVVYPQGRNNRWLSNPSADTSRPNDIDFTDAILSHMNDLLCVDTSRVYAAGKSNGGGFSAVLACNDTVGAKFAVFAGVSAAFYNTDNTPGIGPCRPAQRARGTPFLEFHGLLDTTAPYYGETPQQTQNSKRPVLDVVRQFAQLNGCPANAAAASNDTVFPEGIVKRASWNCGGKNGIVQHYMEQQIGHCWPSIVLNDDVETHRDQCPRDEYVFNATQVIYQFFSRYSLP